VSLFDFLMDQRDKKALAKECVKLAHENADLRNQLFAAQVEIFWIKATEAARRRHDESDDLRMAAVRNSQQERI
jgi:hypothetical protein